MNVWTILNIQNYNDIADKYIHNMDREDCLKYLSKSDWYINTNEYNYSDIYELRLKVYNLAYNDGFIYFCKIQGLIK